jgi:hypothetical protein
MELCGRKMVIKRLTEHFAIDGEMCYRVRGEVAVSWRMVEYMYGVNVKCIAISFHLIVVKHSILMPINYRLGLKRRMSFATGIRIPAVVIGWRCQGSTLLAEPLKVHGLELSLSLSSPPQCHCTFSSCEAPVHRVLEPDRQVRVASSVESLRRSACSADTIGRRRKNRKRIGSKARSSRCECNWVGFVSPDLKGRHLTDWPRRRTTHRFMTIGPMTRTRTLTSLNVW